MKLIVSETQAVRVGEARSGGMRDHAFKVFSYIHPRSKLTCFGVEIIANRETVTVECDPARLSRHPQVGK